MSRGLGEESGVLKGAQSCCCFIHAPDAHLQQLAPACTLHQPPPSCAHASRQVWRSTEQQRGHGMACLV